MKTKVGNKDFMGMGQAKVRMFLSVSDSMPWDFTYDSD